MGPTRFRHGSRLPGGTPSADRRRARLPCAPINDVRGGIEFAERIGLDPVVTVGDGDDPLPAVRNPITFSRTPASYDLRPPGLDADRQPILSWLRRPIPGQA